jgi:hypothetical protein
MILSHGRRTATIFSGRQAAAVRDLLEEQGFELPQLVHHRQELGIRKRLKASLVMFPSHHTTSGIAPADQVGVLQLRWIRFHLKGRAEDASDHLSLDAQPIGFVQVFEGEFLNGRFGMALTQDDPDDFASHVPAQVLGHDDALCR